MTEARRHELARVLLVASYLGAPEQYEAAWAEALADPVPVLEAVLSLAGLWVAVAARERLLGESRPEALESAASDLIAEELPRWAARHGGTSS